MAFKSFYDLTNDTALSAKELFKYRLKRDNSVPTKGGQKDFEPDPDGSWMQSKQLEAFLQEWTSVINEPRVEKLRSLVQGVWDESNKLVNVDKPGKFWAHMGFTDNRRNWLYPEEALFLIEVNALEVYHKGVSMSVQEAYDAFLGNQVTLPQYQVFAHLRRLGYVVLRHETENVITEYERKINLNKYIDKKSYKARKKAAKASLCDTDQQNSEDLTIDVDDQSDTSLLSEKQDEGSKITEEKCLNSTDAPNSVGENDSSAMEVNDTEDHAGESPSKSLKRCREDESEVLDTDDKKRHCSEASATEQTTTQSEETSSLSPHRKFYPEVWSDCFTADKQTPKTCCQQTPWEDLSGFPDIGTTEMLQMSKPDTKLLPSSIQLSEDDDLLCFDVMDYRQKVPERRLSQKQQREEDDEQRVSGLNFSFAEWTRKKPVLKSTSWAEYKEKTAEYWEKMSHATPVSHLWKGEVTPLVSPLDAWSTGTILQKLDIIKSADESVLKVSKSVAKKTPLSFDVHLPDKSFKKSMPGRPDHRVLVTQNAGHPPELCHMMSLCQTDGVPVHWAVVDCGEIAFYVFNTSHKLETLA